MSRLRECWYLGPLRWAWRRWEPAYPRFRDFRANHFIATLERQCAELREIEGQPGHHDYKCPVLCYAHDVVPRDAFAKEFADCISAAMNGLRWVYGNDPAKVAKALRRRSARYVDVDAIIDKYITEHGAHG